jgi:hypothetical protein
VGYHEKFLPTPRHRLALLGFALALMLFFLWANRSSYRGFFTDDDFDNYSNARESSAADFAKAFVSPNAGSETSFRAAAYSYYFVMSRVVGISSYVPYVAGIQLIHLINVLLVFLLVRALGASLPGACAAALLFVFHAAALDVYWKAMYVFDLLCGTFTLACLLAYVKKRTLLSVLCFWLALKSKEVPILLPVVLAMYEFWFGGKNWKRLVPFAAISAMMGGSALYFNAHRDNDYTMRFTFAAFSQCARYYAERLGFVPYAGLALLAALGFVQKRDRFGILTFLLLLGPMLFLPGRLFAAYLYVPLIGLAIAISVVDSPLWIALAFALWIPWNYHQLPAYRTVNVNASRERRDWFTSQLHSVPYLTDVENFVYDGAPESLAPYGVLGAVRALRPPESTTRLAPLGSVEAKAFFAQPKFALLVWDPPSRSTIVLRPTPDASYIQLDASTPSWQLLQGWTGNQGKFRWMEPVAKARLARPEGARTLEVVVNVSEYYIAHAGSSRFEALVDGVSLGAETLTIAKPVTLSFRLKPAPAGAAEVEFRVTPPLADPNNGQALGQPIAAFGFR